MSTKTVCLTWSTLVKKIEEALEDCPEPFAQVAFSNSKVLQRLMAKVLAQLPGCYLAKNPGTVCFLLQEKQYVDELIRQSLFQLFQLEWKADQKLTNLGINLELCLSRTI